MVSFVILTLFIVPEYDKFLLTFNIQGVAKKKEPP